MQYRQAAARLLGLSVIEARAAAKLDISPPTTIGNLLMADGPLPFRDPKANTALQLLRAFAGGWADRLLVNAQARMPELNLPGESDYIDELADRARGNSGAALQAKAVLESVVTGAEEAARLVRRDVATAHESPPGINETTSEDVEDLKLADGDRQAFELALHAMAARYLNPMQRYGPYGTDGWRVDLGESEEEAIQTDLRGRPVADFDFVPGP